MQRTCPICQETKAIQEFPGKGTARNGDKRYSYCKPCHGIYQRKRKLAWLYNLTLEDFETIVRAQGGGCAICKNTKRGKGGIAVDHDHKTGLIRGGVCMPCNRAIGVIEREWKYFEQFREYLMHPPAVAALGGYRYGRRGRTTNKSVTGKKLNPGWRPTLKNSEPPADT